MGKVRYLYDCKNCKFNWNCGYRCDCILKGRKGFSKPPFHIKLRVNWARVIHLTSFNKKYKLFINEHTVQYLPQRIQQDLMEDKLNGR